jgi:hypothetical protein
MKKGKGCTANPPTVWSILLFSEERRPNKKNKKTANPTMAFTTPEL